MRAARESARSCRSRPFEPAVDDRHSELIDVRGEEIARSFRRSHSAAVGRIEEIVGTHGIECAFRRLDGFLFPALDTPADEAGKQIETELEAAFRAGPPELRSRISGGDAGPESAGRDAMRRMAPTIFNGRHSVRLRRAEPKSGTSGR